MIPDAAVPRRDALLRPETMAGVISQRLLDGVPVQRCERAYVKYRVGESLRVVYRYDDTYVAARTGKRDGIAAPEVGAALYPFPHDRKLDLAAVGRLLDPTTTPRLIAWAAEQSATFECRDPSGRVVAYARVQRDAAPWPALDGVRTPRVLAASDDVLLLEPLEGVRLDRARGEGLAALGAALAALHASPRGAVAGAPAPRIAAGAPAPRIAAGAPAPRIAAGAPAPRIAAGAPAPRIAAGAPAPRIAAGAPAPRIAAGAPAPRIAAGAPAPRDAAAHLAPPRFARVDPTRLFTAAEAIGRVRPDAGPAAQRLLASLFERVGDGVREPVLIHGDANLRNALLLPDGDVALLDLEDLSVGPAAADLGQLLAALLINRTSANALLRGYGDLPDGAALRWHTAAALLARQALPAVSRFRPGLLARLPELLDAGSALLTPKAVAA